MSKITVLLAVCILSISACGQVISRVGSVTEQLQSVQADISEAVSGNISEEDIPGQADNPEGTNYSNKTGEISGQPVQIIPSVPSESKENAHSHELSNEDNIIPHEFMGYCGNTVTSIVCQTGERWEKSFWGSNSVALTDLLLYLDYSGNTCRCPAEYQIHTELDGGEAYFINLSEGFARHSGGQVDLTPEQVIQIQEIITRVQNNEEPE